jgi:acyl carrier protein
MTNRDAILAALQRAFDEDLTADLQLDSLDFIDIVMTLGEELPPDAIDAVVDKAKDLRTVGDIVDRFVDLGVTVVEAS